MTGRLLIVWLSCIGAVAEADGPKPARLDWRAVVRKLDQAEQNQVRLGDIIHELERQMRSLKRQVNAATRHKELTDQLKIF